MSVRIHSLSSGQCYALDIFVNSFSFRRLPEPEKEVVIPARDQVKFKMAKPKPAAELPPAEHVEIEKEKAKIALVKQGPEIPKEVCF